MHNDHNACKNYNASSLVSAYLMLAVDQTQGLLLVLDWDAW
jgi:hypothetical protein